MWVCPMLKSSLNWVSNQKNINKKDCIRTETLKLDKIKKVGFRVLIYKEVKNEKKTLYSSGKRSTTQIKCN